MPLRILLALSLLLGAAGLASAQEPEPKAAAKAEDDVLFLLSFGGGGTRAAAFSFGVVQALRKASLLGRVDRVAGVSGGSLLAAQLAVDASPKGLGTFKSQVLLRDIETELFKSAASNTLNLVRGDFNRSHAAAAFYDTLFADARFGAVEGAGPELWIQATDMTSGDPLCFRPSAFAHLGLRAAELSLGTAVAASAAVPGALPPLTLQVPGHAPSQCSGTCKPGGGSQVILADGGISDNLALEALFVGDVPPAAEAVVVVVVNSRRAVSQPWKLDGSGLVSAGMTVALQQRRLDTLTLARARERLRSLALEAKLAGRTLATELIVIDFEGSAARKKLDAIGTRFDLEASEVELLIREGQTLMGARLAPLAELFR